MRMDPTENVKFGTNYLRAMLGKYDDNLINALSAYNQGPGNTDQWLESGGNFGDLPPETRQYISRISERMLGDRDTYEGPL